MRSRNISRATPTKCRWDDLVVVTLSVQPHHGGKRRRRNRPRGGQCHAGGWRRRQGFPPENAGGVARSESSIAGAPGTRSSPGSRVPRFPCSRRATLSPAQHGLSFGPRSPLAIIWGDGRPTRTHHPRVTNPRNASALLESRPAMAPRSLANPTSCRWRSAGIPNQPEPTRGFPPGAGCGFLRSIPKDGRFLQASPCPEAPEGCAKSIPFDHAPVR